jgi:release factor glutamine methyltransferase
VTADDPLEGKSIAAARLVLGARFKMAGIESPQLDARLLIGTALHLDHTGLAVEAARVLSRKEAASIEAFASRRLCHEPVARIIGRKEFWGLDLELSGATLVPRPDTETLVEAAVSFVHDQYGPSHGIRFADIGTGSGAILLALMSALPNAHGVGTDISADALAVAKLNAKNLGFAERSAFIQCDYAAGLGGAFDLIVSNPPYIASAEVADLEIDVRDYDPHLALDGGADGLDAYRAIAPQAAMLLTEKGALIVEIGHGQATAVAQIISQSGLAAGGPPILDLGGVHRVVMGRKP